MNEFAPFGMYWNRVNLSVKNLGRFIVLFFGVPGNKFIIWTVGTVWTVWTVCVNPRLLNAF